MRLLVVATRGADKSSTFFRWTQHEAVLERCGARIEYLFKPQIERERLRALGGFDWVVNLRCPLNGFAARAVASRGRRVCFDFDDAVYTRAGRPYDPFTAWRVARRLRFWLTRAHLVTTSSRYLANWAARWARRVEVIPMAIDLEAWPAEPAAERADDRLRIGWVGSPATLSQLERLDAVLAPLMKRRSDATLAVYCGERPKLSFPFEFTPYEPGGDRAFIRRIDVGLLPLYRDEFTMGKSPIKALQYLACSVPVVANRFGATAEMLDDTNSLHVEAEPDWGSALETILDAPDLRRSLGAAGRRRVETDHDAAAIGRRIHALLAEAVPSSP